MNLKTKRWLGKPGDESNLVMLDIKDLPYPIYYVGGGKPVRVYRLRCHKLVAADLEHRLMRIWTAARLEIKMCDGYSHATDYYDTQARKLLHDLHLDCYAGCYAYRPQRGSTATSSHAWGAALDWNPAENALGTRGNMPRWWVNCWTDIIGYDGFSLQWGWGGSWKRCDPMHVELCYWKK